MTLPPPEYRKTAVGGLAKSLDAAQQQTGPVNTQTGTFEAVLAALQIIARLRLSLRQTRALLLLAREPALSVTRLAVECQCKEDQARHTLAILFSKGLILCPFNGLTPLSPHGQETAGCIVACAAMGEAAFHMRQLTMQADASPITSARRVPVA